MGIEIAKQIDQVKDTYGVAVKHAANGSEQKIYLLMGAFYKLVLFKTKESQDELIKNRNAIQNRKLLRLQGSNAMI